MDPPGEDDSGLCVLLQHRSIITSTLSSLEEEETPDLHLSLECGSSADKMQSPRPETPRVPPEGPEPEEPTKHPASRTLFLSRTNLKEVADSVLQNSSLKNLYLEGNQISNLPDSMFISLPNLLWLDLRNNQITSIPAGIGLHRSLKTLLLEGNPIAELPPELGNVITLKALSLRNCPIRFPPQHIVYQGLPCILLYLRSAMAERTVSARKSCPDLPPVERLQLSELVRSSVEEQDESVDEEALQKFRELKHRMMLLDRAELGCQPLTPQGDRNHTPPHPLPLISRKKEITKANIILELPLCDVQHAKRSVERRLTAVKELREKQIVLEQRKKDQEFLQEWRTHAKIMQGRKMLKNKRERHEKQRRKEEAEKPVGTAEAELGAADRSDGPQRLQTSYRSQEEREEARAARDHELEQRIRAHMKKMQQRHRRPRGTVAEKTVAAQQDLEETRKLHAELMEKKRHKETEYRFTAFTGGT
ncbi:leucine-rich repeat-containing protein 27 [Myripristis murdjan]|uniref:Leucine-rich repeat protein SHOC-2 n=1 Tax=Myripristis murdjan TaxID=586833 RepID=A0A668AEG2_9TELE|nr:leucine-rich repeat-containing protein 27 [Myripristis murdjan]